MKVASLLILSCAISSTVCFAKPKQDELNYIDKCLQSLPSDFVCQASGLDINNKPINSTIAYQKNQLVKKNQVRAGVRYILDPANDEFADLQLVTKKGFFGWKSYPHFKIGCSKDGVLDLKSISFVYANRIDTKPAIPGSCQ